MFALDHWRQIKWDGQMSQWKKALAAKHHNLSSIPGTLLVQGRSSYKLSSDLHMCAVASASTPYK